MQSIFEISGPTAGPKAPKKWSFSSLSEWRVCPRRWWLRRAQYGSIGRYPTPVHPRAVEGELVHATLEAYVRHATRMKGSGGCTGEQAAGTFDGRRFIQNRFRTVLDTRLRDNPRVGVAWIRSRVSIDRCVNQFKLARRIADTELVRSNVATWDAGQRGESRSSGLTGVETRIDLMGPPLSARLDLVKGGRIIDVKSGMEQEEHRDQVTFYGLVFWIKTGRVPKALRLVYARSGRLVDVPVPTTAEFGRLRSEVGSEVAAAKEQIAAGQPTAEPGTNKCEFCAFRQYCPEYWTEDATRALRVPADLSTPQDSATATYWRDLEIRELETKGECADWMGTGQCVGLGRVSVAVDRSRRPTARGWRYVRILGARAKRQHDGWEITLGRRSEVFWLA